MTDTEILPIARDELDQQIRELRAALTKTGLAVVERCAYKTGMDAGPGALNLIDQLITAYSHEHARLTTLCTVEDLVAEQEAQLNPIDQAPLPEAAHGLDLAHCKLTDLLGVFDRVPPIEHPSLAGQLLDRARAGGARADVVAWLELEAEKGPGRDELLTLVWPGGSLPGPGSLLSEFPGAEALGVPLPVKMVGFGEQVGTIRVRPLTDDERAEYDLEQAQSTEIGAEGPAAGTGMKTTY